MSNNKIKFIYDSNSFSTGNSSLISAGVVIFFMVCIIVYLGYKMILKDISYDWEHKRCTPRYIFYSGFLKSPTGDPFKDTFNNFIECTDPTKTDPGKESRFKNVYDTAETIVKTSNTVIDYSNDIMNESDRIMNESNNRIYEMKSKTDVLNTSMNQLYNYQMKLFTILKLYFERIFLILDTISRYVVDITLFRISNMRYSLDYQGVKLSSFITTTINQYKNIYDTDITDAVTQLKNIKEQAGSNYNDNNIDYDPVIEAALSAKEKYKTLTNLLIAFDESNRDKLLEIDNNCRELTNKNINYKSIFPFLEIKLLNPELFNSVNIV